MEKSHHVLLHPVRKTSHSTDFKTLCLVGDSRANSFLIPLLIADDNNRIVLQDNINPDLYHNEYINATYIDVSINEECIA